AGPLHVTAKSFYPYCIGLSVMFQVVLLPLIGAIADYSTLKIRALRIATYVGSIITCLLFFVSAPTYLVGGLLLASGNLVFGISQALYNSLWSDVAPDDQRDKVSSRGYAIGYLGGGVLLVLNLAL